MRRTGSQLMPVSSAPPSRRPRSRVADVGPPGRVQPHARVGSLDEEDRPSPSCTTARPPPSASRSRGLPCRPLHPLVDPLLRAGRCRAGDGPDVGGDLDTSRTAPLVEVLGEPDPGASDARQRLGPADEVLPTRQGPLEVMKQTLERLRGVWGERLPRFPHLAVDPACPVDRRRALSRRRRAPTDSASKLRLRVETREPLAGGGGHARSRPGPQDPRACRPGCLARRRRRRPRCPASGPWRR